MDSRGSEEGKERTDWHRLTCWNRLAQFVEDHVTTGDRIYVEGRIEYDSYERDGVTIPTAEITVRELVMLSPKAVAAGSGRRTRPAAGGTGGGAGAVGAAPRVSQPSPESAVHRDDQLPLPPVQPAS